MENRMKITGYKLQHKLKQLEQLKEVHAQQFTDNVMHFESSEDKLDLKEVFAHYTAVEKKIARLQAAQAAYNMQIKINVLGEEMTLLEAVKLVGGAGRSEKMWKDVVKSGGVTRHRFAEATRSKDQEYAKRSVSVEEALKHAQLATKVASSLREGIQTANAIEIELDLDETLFD